LALPPARSFVAANACRALVDAAFEKDMKLERTILAGLEADERKTLSRLLTKLAADVEAGSG
jgi:hypothetical protein